MFAKQWDANMNPSSPQYYLRHWKIQGADQNLLLTGRLKKTGTFLNVLKGQDIFMNSASGDPATPENCLAKDKYGNPFKDQCACKTGYFLDGIWPREECIRCSDARNPAAGRQRTTLPVEVTRGARGYQSCLMCVIGYYGSFDTSTPCKQCPPRSTTLNDDRREAHDCTCTQPGYGLDKATKTCKRGVRTAREAGKGLFSTPKGSIDLGILGVRQELDVYKGLLVFTLIILFLCTICMTLQCYKDKGSGGIDESAVPDIDSIEMGTEKEQGGGGGGGEAPNWQA